MTIRVSQTLVLESTCLLTKKVVRLDTKTDEMMGGQEIKIQSSKDIIEVCKILESERSVRATSMNCASSRSHAIIELRVYRKFEDKMRANCFNFVDLAGSERFPPSDGGFSSWGMQ